MSSQGAMRRWAVFYDDGSLYSSEDGYAVSEVPEWGVVAIVQQMPEFGCEVVHTTDYYIWRDGKWWGCEISGLFDHVVRGGTWLKFGRMLLSEDFKRIRGEAAEFAEQWRNER